MAFLLFVDESGHDRKASPYEVLAGVAVEDQDLWNMILALRDAEVRYFGMRYSEGPSELKASKLLKRKTFRLANQMSPIEADRRSALARACLTDGPGATREQLTALAQAKLEFAKEALRIAGRFRCRAFASIVNPRAAPIDPGIHLRKDYAFLLERFFYFLQDTNPGAMGLVVFDEVEASQSLRLLEQMHGYFLRTENGQTRASQIVPEPLFVRSELTSGIQLADLVAYIISWGFRGMRQTDLPRREELDPFVELVTNLRYRTSRDVGRGRNQEIWSFCWIDALRVRQLGR